MTINERQDNLIQKMNPLTDWFDKYEFIIDMGKKLEKINKAYKTQENSISGCQSKVWLHAELKEGNLHFSIDSDTVITRGLGAILLEICNNIDPHSLYEADLYFLDKIGLSTNLSPSRANGLASIVKRIKDTAKKYL